jgi:hypothetical protein
MVESRPLLPGLSPVSGAPVEARFDGGRLSSDGGLLVLREVETRLDVAHRLAACLRDPRDPERIDHALDEMVRFRCLMIAAGYPDGNDADTLREDPVFKMSLDRRPASGPELCSQPSISRLENMASRTDLYRMGQAMIDLYCASYRQVPKRIVLDIDDAPNNCACSTRATTSTASSRSTSTTPAGAWSPRCCARPSARAARRS